MISDHLDGSCVEFDAMRCDGSKDDEGGGKGGGGRAKRDDIALFWINIELCARKIWLNKARIRL